MAQEITIGTRAAARNGLAALWLALLLIFASAAFAQDGGAAPADAPAMEAAPGDAAAEVATETEAADTAAAETETAAAPAAKALPPAEGGIGAQARQRAEQTEGVKEPVTTEKVEELQGLMQFLVLALLVLIVILVAMALHLVKFNPFKNVSINKGHATLWVLFGLAFFGFTIYEAMAHLNIPTLFANAASEHGAEIDGLFQATIGVTVLVFFLTHIALFYFAFKYRSRKGTKALFYPDNTKLELIWTLVPAVALAIMVLYGVIVWYDINHPPYEERGEKPLEIELVAEQFQWRIRYPGADGELGKAGFAKISDTNPIGIDSTDKAAQDDVIPIAKEIHVPKGQPVKLRIRSKDVLHGVYMPHFRVNMYAVPGMPTQFSFTPTQTTEEYRVSSGIEDFDFELACSQICGASHFNMRVLVVVEDEASYKKWLLAQNTVGAPAGKNLADVAKTAETNE